MILDLLGNFLRAGGNTVKTSSLIKAWNSKIKAPNGGTLGIFCKEIVTTVEAGSHYHITSGFPAGAIILGIAARCLTEITLDHDRTGLQLRIHTHTGDYYGTLTANSSHVIAAGTTFATSYICYSTDPTPLSEAKDVVVMYSGGTTGTGLQAGGTIRIQLWYLLATAPTGA